MDLFIMIIKIFMKIKEGKKNGKGKMIYYNENIFNGEWKNDNIYEGDLIEKNNGNIFKGKLKKVKKME